MIFPRRALGLGCFCLCIAFYAYAPALLSLDAAGMLFRALIVQVGGPLLATVSCFAAACRSRRSRMAWGLFGAAMALYSGGNAYYAGHALSGFEPTFPSLAEWAYLAMAPVFAAGVFVYGGLHRRLSRTRVLNFLLVLSAIAVATFFLLEAPIARSSLGPFAAGIAVVYPVVWCSVAASAVLVVIQFNLAERTHAFNLLGAAAVSEAFADSLYVGAILDGTYSRGGVVELLWVASIGFVIWASVIEMAQGRRLARWFAPPKVVRRSTQAVIPAVAIAVALGAATLSGTETDQRYPVVILLAVIIFALLAGLREYWIAHQQRMMQTAVEVTRNALLDSEGRLTAVLQSTTDSIVVLDGDWRITFMNRQAQKLLESAPAFKLGAVIWDTIEGFEDLLSARMYRQAMDTGQPVEFDEHFPDLWINIHAYPTAQGGLSIFLRDITEARRHSDEILHLAHHDSLTGLANRTKFLQRLDETAKAGDPSTTLLLDLDHFKDVNDSLGHPVGDLVLRATAERLGGCLRPQDTIARLGGDEFAIIVAGDVSRTDLAVLARDILRATCMPLELEGRLIKVSASLGIAQSSQVGRNPEYALRAADIALYAAKSNARGTFSFFEPAMEARLLEEQALRNELALALQRNEFELEYQPILDLSTMQVASFEALLRWNHPTRGRVSPAMFIPVAEESGLIVTIGEWVLMQACSEAMNWPKHVSVAVNLSTRQFHDGRLTALVQESLVRSGLPSSRLELEITETVLLEDEMTNVATLHRLRGLGVRIALDDFGTGYSSLGYLQHFPFDKIKIDQAFISGLPANGESQAIVKMVVGLGKALGLRVTAEGVETNEQLHWVRRGCNEAQGYFISRPTSASEVPALIERLNASGRARTHRDTRPKVAA